MESGGFLDRILGLLLKTGLQLMKSVLKALAKNDLIPLGWEKKHPQHIQESTKNLWVSGNNFNSFIEGTGRSHENS